MSFLTSVFFSCVFTYLLFHFWPIRSSQLLTFSNVEQLNQRLTQCSVFQYRLDHVVSALLLHLASVIRTLSSVAGSTEAQYQFSHSLPLHLSYRLTTFLFRSHTAREVPFLSLSSLRTDPFVDLRAFA